MEGQQAGEKMVQEISHLIQNSLNSLESSPSLELPDFHTSQWHERSGKLRILATEYGEKISREAEATSADFAQIAGEMDLFAEMLRLWLADARALREQLVKAIQLPIP
ncbi:MAG: hypothetical protein EXR99_01255 [Gemmataceae bacterium]|nr:hypothetical protein [Gemmataceae bacterium]